MENSPFDVEDVIRNASIQEKISLLSGKDFWHTQPLERFNVPSIRTSDGPNGIRGTKFFNSVPSACLPCGTALASTWDLKLLYEAGDLLGKECHAKGVHCWLGPTVEPGYSELPYNEFLVITNKVNCHLFFQKVCHKSDCQLQLSRKLLSKLTTSQHTHLSNIKSSKRGLNSSTADLLLL
ncbi:hypothetical protein VE00_10524 [Pseudogymnoascus sp. WSF 3629]|nr:hypothetical protein VE00_10524 [Pseudogymnoascus sp. WSF 3629]